MFEDVKCQCHSCNQIFENPNFNGAVKGKDLENLMPLLREGDKVEVVILELTGGISKVSGRLTSLGTGSNGLWLGTDIIGARCVRNVGGNPGIVVESVRVIELAATSPDHEHEPDDSEINVSEVHVTVDGRIQAIHYLWSADEFASFMRDVMPKYHTIPNVEIMVKRSELPF